MGANFHFVAPPLVTPSPFFARFPIAFGVPVPEGVPGVPGVAGVVGALVEEDVALVDAVPAGLLDPGVGFVGDCLPDISESKKDSKNYREAMRMK